MARPWNIAGIGLVALGACAAATTPPAQAVTAQYLGVQTFLLEDDLVNFVVKMEGVTSAAMVSDYAQCAAVQYAQIRGYGFTRHIRTQVAQEGGLLLGDAVYTISPTLPAGVRTINVDASLRDCAARGIPTI